MKNQPLKAEDCPNCGRELNGANFCPNCGQPNDIRRLTTRDFLHESLSNLFAVDGRLFHTLRNLFRYPGRIPKEYMAGKRMQYMNPIRIYFISSLILLFILQFDEHSGKIVEIKNSKETAQTQPAEPSNTDVAPVTMDSLDASLHNGRENPATAITKKNDAAVGKIERMMNFYEARPGLSAEAALDSMHLENDMMHRFLYAQSAKLADFDDEEFSKFFFSKMFWVLFLFLPVLALLQRLLYARRKFYYPEHLFFTFYSQSVFFITFSLALVLYIIFSAEAILITAFAFFGIYLFLAMRRFYGQSFGKTLLKFTLLNILALPLFTFFFVLAGMVAFILF